MVTREDVLAAYRLILGREPENDQAIEDHIANATDLAALRRRFFSSLEFLEQNTSGIHVGRHYKAPPMNIQDGAANKLMNQMFNQIGQTWRAFGESEPYWSVLTMPQFLQENITQGDINYFYETGFDGLEAIRSLFARNRTDMKTIRTVLEFGAGVGRVTFALASEFAKVIGVDVSEYHIKIAKERAAQIGSNNIEFLHVAATGDLKALPATDFLYSILVLQHNPPPVIEFMLRTLLRKVRRGGYAMFQVPTYRLQYEFESNHYLSHPTNAMEMHALESRKVFAILRSLNFEVLEVHEDCLVGSPAFISQSFFARRAFFHLGWSKFLV